MKEDLILDTAIEHSNFLIDCWGNIPPGQGVELAGLSIKHIPTGSEAIFFSSLPDDIERDRCVSDVKVQDKNWVMIAAGPFGSNFFHNYNVSLI